MHEKLIYVLDKFAPTEIFSVYKIKWLFKK